MDKERLKKLRSLIKEAEHLEIEIEETRWFPKEPVADSAKDYRTRISAQHNHSRIW